MKVRNRRSYAVTIEIPDQPIIEVDANGVADVDDALGGRAPKWIRKPTDAVGEPGEEGYKPADPGELDPGEGLLAQPDNWEPVKADKAGAADTTKES